MRNREEVKYFNEGRRAMTLEHIEKLIKNTTRIGNGVPVFAVPELFESGIYESDRYYYTVVHEFVAEGKIKKVLDRRGGNGSACLYTIAEYTPTAIFIPDRQAARPIMARTMKKLGVFSSADLVDAAKITKKTAQVFIRECVKYGYVELHRKKTRYQGRGGIIKLYRVTEKVQNAGR